MGECSDCRFWEIVKEAPRVGVCHMLCTARIDNADLLLMGLGGGMTSTVLTDQEFGCIQFETRESATS